jgi:hypothetical protein
VILGLGWVKYFDPSTRHDFYVHNQLGTQWHYPSQLAALQKQTPEIDEDDISQISGDNQYEGSSTSISVMKRGLKPQSSAMMLFEEIDQSEIQQLDDDDENDTSFRSSYRDEDANGTQTSSARAEEEEEDDNTDDSDADEDILERGRRLGGGFRTRPRPPSPPPTIETESSDIILSESTAAMMAKLQGSRAAANGDIMSKQAAFNAQGMLMLESIQKKGDPNLEQDADPEVIAKIEAERLRFQEV